MPRMIALDLGAHSVKVSLYRTVGRNQVELDQRFAQPVPQDGPVPTLEQRLAALDVLLDDHPALKPQSSDLVALAFPSNEAAFHRLSMPFVDKTQVERTLPFTVENEVPFELDEMVLAWRYAEKGAGRADVMAVLARRERVREWLTALAQRKIDPAGVHVDADLFGRWGGVASVPVDAVDAPPEPLVAVLDVGHVHTTLSVVRRGVVQLARSINVAGWAFTKAIAEGANVSWAEAERLKHGGTPEGDDVDAPTETVGAPLRLPGEARRRLDGAIGLLLAEVRGTLIKAEDSLGAEVAEIRLTGGGSRLAEIAEFLHTDLGVPVLEVVDPTGAPVPREFAVCRALALSTVDNSSVADLRVGDLAFRGRTDVMRSILGYALAGSVFFTLAAVVMFAIQYRNLMVEEADTEAAIVGIVTRSFPELTADQLGSMDKAQAIMAEFTEDAVQRAKVLGSGSGGVPPTVDTLYALTKAFPPHPDVKVELSDLTVINGQSITFNAETDGYTASSAVEAQLKQTPRFSAATKGQEQKLNNGRVRFPITIELGEDAVAEAQSAADEEG